MRLSVLKNDPGYSPDAFKEGVRVLLDGAEVTGVVTANEEDGWVRCLLDHSEETCVRRGKVEIVWPEAAAKTGQLRTKPGYWDRR